MSVSVYAAHRLSQCVGGIGGDGGVDIVVARSSAIYPVASRACDGRPRALADIGFADLTSKMGKEKTHVNVVGEHRRHRHTSTLD